MTLLLAKNTNGIPLRDTVFCLQGILLDSTRRFSHYGRRLLYKSHKEGWETLCNLVVNFS